MIQDPKTLSLKPFNLEHLLETIPELERFNFNIHSSSFEEPIDSSNATPELWSHLVSVINDNYNEYDGFVILHGTDTMAYTASALSYAFEGLSKPVILTGSQLPIGMLRTDGKENLISSIEIAATLPQVFSENRGEVCIYFDGFLFRGNRTIKSSTQHFEAFESPNFPALAEVGVDVKFDLDHFLPNTDDQFSAKADFSDAVGVLYLFPGITIDTVKATFSNQKNLVYIMRTFGSGNGPTNDEFINLLHDEIKKGKVILNITQCDRGAVDQGKYESSGAYKKIGVVGGLDMTFESAITKSMFLLGQGYSGNELKQLLIEPICGELSI
jgi:L-asparaginase